MATPPTTPDPAPTAPRWVRPFAWAEARLGSRAAMTTLAVALVIYGANVTSRRMGDYDVYHQAARRMLAGAPVYDLEDAHRFLYAPVFTFLFAPLAPFPALPGKIVWYLANLILAVLVVRRTLQLVFPGGRAPPGFRFLLVLLSLRFFDNNIAHGQLNLLILWLVLEGHALARRRRTALAGLCLAAAILTKIFPGILLLPFAIRRQWSILVATAAGFAGLLVAPALWWGAGYADVLGRWVSVVHAQATHYEMGNKINQSISAFAYRLFRPHPGGWPLLELSESSTSAIALVLHAVFLVALVSTSLRRRTASTPGGVELSLYLIYATVLSPYSWKYYFVNLVLPFGVLLAHLWRPHRRSLEWAVGAIFLLNLVPGQKVFGKTAGLAFQLFSFHFLAASLLFGVLLARSRRSAPAGPAAQAPTA